MNVLAISILRNAAPNLLYLKTKILKLLKVLEKYTTTYHLFIYENDSIDYTKRVLQTIQKLPHITIVSETLFTTYNNTGISNNRL